MTTTVVNRIRSRPSCGSGAGGRRGGGHTDQARAGRCEHVCVVPGDNGLAGQPAAGRAVAPSQRAGLLCGAVGVLLVTVQRLVGAFFLLLEDQPAHFQVQLLGVGQVIDVAQGLVLSG
jgi:hypothetical protein